MSGSRLERLGHVMFIVMCVALSAAAVQYVLTSRSAAAPVKGAVVAKGIKVTLPADPRGAATPSVLLVLNSQCRFCTQSMPFYGRLAQLKSVKDGRVRLSAISLEPPGTLERYLATHNLRVASVIPIAQTGFNVNGTPGLVLAASDGVVIDSWDGWLNPEQEQDVVRAIEKLSRD